MTGVGLAGAALATALCAVSATTIPPASEVVFRHEIFRGSGVTAYLLEIPPARGTQMHRHDKDILTVFISGGRTTAVFEGEPARADVLPPGTVRYRTAGFAHSTRNDDETPFRAVILEFDASQGPRTGTATPPELFCTTGFCVDDLSVASGAAAPAGALFVAVGDVEAREASGARHAHAAGTVWAGPGGWTNAGPRPARVVSIRFRPAP